jgi:nucleoside-diphosphate-sugar epimerase
MVGSGNIFITGASGFIGRRLATTLAESGMSVHALIRKTSAREFLQHQNMRIFFGDLSDRESIIHAMTECSQVFHLGGLAKMWMKDKRAYHQVNVTGTENVLSAARLLGVDKVVVTSTAGVFPPSKETMTNEQSLKRPELYTEYEKTKNAAEEMAFSYYLDGLPVVLVNPTKVYGPGPIDDSNTATLMVRDYLLGKWRIIPGTGKGTMNYVYIDDAVSGMIAAMELGTPGAQYIIGGENASYNEFFELVQQLSLVRRKLFQLPYPIIRTVAWWEEIKTKLFDAKPLVTTEWVKKLPYDWSKDISKAKRELNYHPRSLEEGLKQTINWLYQSIR